MIVTLPKSGFLSWLTRPRRPVSEEVRARLLGNLGEPTALILGSISACSLTLGAYLATDSFWLLALALTDLSVLAHRVFLLRRIAAARKADRPVPAQPFLINGLIFSAASGLTAAFCFMAGQPELKVIGPFTMMGFLTAIVARNGVLPNFTIVQVCLLGGPIQVALLATGKPVWLLLFAQFPLFMMIVWKQVVRMSDNLVSVLEAERESQRRARIDGLTGLMNRAGFATALGGLEPRPEHVTFLFIDLDDFKGVNDRFGHAAGDETLQIVARRLLNHAPEGAFVARLGGDEFVIAMPGLDEAAGQRLGERVILAVGMPIVLSSGATVSVGASIGVATSDGDNFDFTLQRADVALYDAKASGKGRTAKARVLPNAA